MTKAIRFADGGGVAGAVFAALCCAGLPLIVRVLATVGLAFPRTDAILLALMALSLAIALWGFWGKRRMHGAFGTTSAPPLWRRCACRRSVVIHGFPAKQVIGIATATLIAATLWNVRLRRACE